MTLRAAGLSLLAVLAFAAASPAARAAETPADRLAAPAAIPDMPRDGDFYVVKEGNDEHGPSYMRVSPASGGPADGWMVEVFSKPVPTDNGPADYVAGYFRFDCQARTARILSMVFYNAKGRLVDRLDQEIVPDFKEESPIWLLMRAACDRAFPDYDRFASMDAVIADAATR